MKDTSRPTIVVVGSANTDMIVRMPRLPERGETVLGGEFVSAGGGKGANQAVAASRLGAEVCFIARLGNDPLGDAAITAFRAEGLRTEWISRDAHAPSGIALILVESQGADQGENMIAVAPGANARLAVGDVEGASSAIATSDCLVAQLEVPLDTVLAALRLARALGVKTILNPAPVPAAGLPAEIYPLVDVLNPNRTEAGLLSGTAVADDESAERAARVLLERGVGAVVVTLGSQGALVVTADATRRIKPFRVVAMDATGAGDAFTGGLAVALAGGASVADAADFAGAVGALAATKLGAQPSLPTSAEVRALIVAQRGTKSRLS